MTTGLGFPGGDHPSNKTAHRRGYRTRNVDAKSEFLEKSTPWFAFPFICNLRLS
jgi:hypothetical protein